MPDDSSPAPNHTGLLLDNLIAASRERLKGIRPCTELVIAGPSCTGKTRFAPYAAGMLRYQFVEGDLFHLQRVMELAKTENIPMTDEYRETDWFKALSGGLLFAALQHIEIVMSCSCLKRSFRDMLVRLGTTVGMGDLWIVWMDVPAEVLRERAAKRQRETNHPFGPEMIDSQLADSEMPTSDEANVIVVDGTLEQDALLREIVRQIPGLPAVGL